MKFFPTFLLCAIALIAIVSVQPVMAIVDMNPFDTDVPGSFPYPFSATDPGSFPYPFSNDISESNGNSGGFGAYNSSDWVFDISIPRTDGSTWQPYSDLSVPGVSGTWSGPVEYITPVDSGGWWSPLTPSGIPVSPTASPTSAPVDSGGWWSPLTPSGIPVSPAASPTSAPAGTGGWWSPLTPAVVPVLPTATPTATLTPTPTPTLTPPVQGDEPQISITALNLQGEYLRIRNNGMTPVVMTGYKITNGQGRSLTFIDWPRGDGSTFTFVLSPLSTVTVYYSREGTVTATELYWPTGGDAWSQPGDTAYLYDPQGRLVSSFTAESSVSPAATPTATSTPTPTPTPTPTTTLTPVVQGDEPQISITALNLQGEYLKIRNNGAFPVVMTGYKITNGQGRSLTFIDWPRGDGSTFTFVLSPLSTVTVYYSREGTVTASELYWPTGGDAWSQPGDTAYLYDPQGRLVSSFTA